MFVAMCMFLINELVYDQLGAITVNWMITYYSVNYLAIVLISIEQSIFNGVRYLRWFYAFISLSFGALLVIELSYINSSLEAYVGALDNRIASNWILIIAILIIGLITHESWRQHLKTFFTR
jgi:hypothetical protein